MMVEIKTVSVRHVMLYTTHGKDWIDATKLWHQEINQKKQNLWKCFRGNSIIVIEVQSYFKKGQKYI